MISRSSEIRPINRFAVDNAVALGLDLMVAERYADRLQAHIAYVREAGAKIGVSGAQLQLHDFSKWSVFEFPAYARHFCGEGDLEGFAVAWLHHVHHNPHHWEHWLLPSGWGVGSPNVVNGALPMPSHFAAEMVADWMGAGMAYTGSWDMSDWLAGNWKAIQLHPQTRQQVATILIGLGHKVEA